MRNTKVIFNATWSHISCKPLMLAWPSLPMMMWSWMAMPKGVGSPEGCSLQRQHPETCLHLLARRDEIVAGHLRLRPISKAPFGKSRIADRGGISGLNSFKI
uniref:hypothetical protein n=1 Tax=Oryzibacter oryziterrae TaxID=2766474 RepID=UPI001F2E0430|nr:hypothetical protein [Oryzibacter oryziterrae]